MEATAESHAIREKRGARADHESVRASEAEHPFDERAIVIVMVFREPASLSFEIRAEPAAQKRMFEQADGRKGAGGERGIRTLGRALRPYGGLANRWFQPLTHLSVAYVELPT
jgi:hypothetical protein